MPRIYCIIVALFAIPEVLAQEVFKDVSLLMGSRFEITVVAESEEVADSMILYAKREIVRIERLISSWDEGSQTSEVNRMAGIRPVQVDHELLSLVDRALEISVLTDGAFDISYASMDRIWKFDGEMMVMPSKQEIALSVSRVGFAGIEIDHSNQTIFLKEKGMKIGFGAIGKGYAADRAAQLLQNKGVVSGIINASGDLTAWGSQPDGEAWKVAITNPLDKKKSYGLLPIYDGAVVTSGTYEKYVILDGKRYGHIIDPRTGYPAGGILSVTVFAPKAELADALATAVFVMGVDVGIDRINQLPQIECIIIDIEGHIHHSNNLKIN